jgi:acetyl-CoA carboxylase carboxyltransferase component
MAIVWDTHLGGWPVSLIGIESRPLPRLGWSSADGPETWSGGTLFPLASKKVARAINAASNNRPVVVLANLSGFDGSPESMRRLQLEHGAEIGRAVTNFRGPLVFCVVARYHGGAYVVFSKRLNPSLRALAVRGSYASVIGGPAAAAVVFPEEARALALEDPRVVELERRMKGSEAPASLRQSYRELVARVHSFGGAGHASGLARSDDRARGASAGADLRDRGRHGRAAARADGAARGRGGGRRGVSMEPGKGRG